MLTIHFAPFKNLSFAVRDTNIIKEFVKVQSSR